IFVIHNWLDLLSRKKGLLTKGRVNADQGRIMVKAGARLWYLTKSDLSTLQYQKIFVQVAKRLSAAPINACHKD
mgnify:CR=1